MYNHLGTLRNIKVVHIVSLNTSTWCFRN